MSSFGNTVWNAASLTDAFRAIGLQQGDLVLVHSALRRLGPVAGGPDTVIDALLAAVGPMGTVAVPTHTWKVVTREQPVFHQTFTPSHVGALGNVLRLRTRAIRSLHPTHSVAAIGPLAAALTSGHEQDGTPCSPNSPYGRLRDWGGKILIIGADLSCCTFFHGCEEWAGMPWASTPEPVQLISFARDGRIIPVAVRHPYVNTWDRYPELEPHLRAAGAIQLGQLGTCPLRLLDARMAADWLIGQLHQNPELLIAPKA